MVVGSLRRGQGCGRVLRLGRVETREPDVGPLALAGVGAQGWARRSNSESFCILTWSISRHTRHTSHAPSPSPTAAEVLTPNKRLGEDTSSVCRAQPYYPIGTTFRAV